MAQFLRFIILLTHLSCSSQKEEAQDIDNLLEWKFNKRILSTYLCTGDNKWYREISKESMLRFIVHAQIEIYCQDYFEWENLNDLIKEARFATERQTRRKECRFLDVSGQELKMVTSPQSYVRRRVNLGGGGGGGKATMIF